MPGTLGGVGSESRAIRGKGVEMAGVSLAVEHLMERHEVRGLKQDEEEDIEKIYKTRGNMRGGG